MKKIAILACSAFLIGCADSDVGGPAERETGSDSSASAPVSNPAEPGVAPDPGTRPAESIGSSVNPSVTAPVAGFSNATAVPAPETPEAPKEIDQQDTSRDRENLPARETEGETTASPDKPDPRY